MKKSGGGITMSKNVNVGVRKGAARADVVSPASARQIGQSLGYQRDALPIGQKAAPVQLGNAVALNVGKGGPGAGRDVHRSGSQGKH